MSNSAKLIFGNLLVGIGDGVTSYGSTMRDAKMSALKRQRQESDKAEALALRKQERAESRADVVSDAARVRGFQVEDIERREEFSEETATTGFERTKTLKGLDVKSRKEAAVLTADARVEAERKQLILNGTLKIDERYAKILEKLDPAFKEDAEKADQIKVERDNRVNAYIKQVNSLHEEDIPTAKQEIDAAFGGGEKPDDQKPSIQGLPDDRNIDEKARDDIITAMRSEKGDMSTNAIRSLVRRSMEKLDITPSFIGDKEALELQKNILNWATKQNLAIKKEFVGTADEKKKAKAEQRKSSMVGFGKAIETFDPSVEIPKQKIPDAAGNTGKRLSTEQEKAVRNIKKMKARGLSEQEIGRALAAFGLTAQDIL